MIKLKCVEYSFGWDDPFIYFHHYYSVDLNPQLVESVRKSGWKLNRTSKETIEVKGFFGRVRTGTVSTAVPYRQEDQIYTLTTASGETYRTYEKDVLIEAGLLV